MWGHLLAACCCTEPSPSCWCSASMLPCKVACLRTLLLRWMRFVLHIVWLPEDARLAEEWVHWHWTTPCGGMKCVRAAYTSVHACEYTFHSVAQLSVMDRLPVSPWWGRSMLFHLQFYLHVQCLHPHGWVASTFLWPLLFDSLVTPCLQGIADKGAEKVMICAPHGLSITSGLVLKEGVLARHFLQCSVESALRCNSSL